MDKQKQIEEMVKTMGNWAQRNNMCWNDGHAKSLAEALSEEYQPKIPENAVVLTREEYKEILDREYELKRWALENGAKTAEKFAERLKSLVAERNCNEDYDWEDVQIDGQIFVECIDEICKGLTEGKK